MSKFSRRDFLKTGALTSLFAGTALTGCNITTTSSTNWKGSAKNIIFMVSDGMSAGTLSMADHMKRLQFGRASNWISMYEENIAKRSLMDMASSSSIVTDSAAAASSWGCGQRIVNGALNMGPNGEIYTPIYEHFKNAGKKTGLVTTTTITHATPSGFLINMARRGDEPDIAVQLLERGADVLFGGGNRFFSGDIRADGRDLYPEFAAKGYNVARNKADLANLTNDGKPVLGIFYDTHVPYMVDHVNIPEHVENIPTLSEMTEVALQRLQNSNGFILQIEGGKIDHAAHSNDASGLVYDQIEFDNALGVVLQFINQNPDTLLIVTSDHGNANPGLNGDGSNYGDSNKMFESLSKATRSNNYILSELGPNDSAGRIREVVEAYTTHAITTEQAQILRLAIRREYTNLYKMMSSASGVLGQILANYTAVNFIGSNHTSDLVELAAIGPGSEAINGFVKNTELFTLMLQAAGVRTA
jgi:alkaline phosphatase